MTTEVAAAAHGDQGQDPPPGECGHGTVAKTTIARAPSRFTAIEMTNAFIKADPPATKVAVQTERTDRTTSRADQAGAETVSLLSSHRLCPNHSVIGRPSRRLRQQPLT
jgi:hypothetical protein